MTKHSLEIKSHVEQLWNAAIAFSWLLHLKNPPTTHLCFKQAQPKIRHSPKVDDGVEFFFFNFLNTYFRTFKKK